MAQYILHSIELPIGKFLLMEQDGHLCALTTYDQLPQLQKQLQKHIGDTMEFCVAKTPLLLNAELQLNEYFEQKRTSFDLPIQLYGSDFQRAVWNKLMQIPYGQTCSYGSIAAQLNTKGTQAVGTAIGKNPLPIIVPCHRVLPRNQTLGNFSMVGGPTSKAYLLDLEDAQYIR